MNRVKEQKSESKAQTAAPRSSRGAARELHPLEDFTAYVQEYARQRPETVALACIGVGFVLGWKLKLW
ncbi:MAG: hypothetical protein HY290_30880 [Planctomycetia bacterium]|nr:hypothetical protein [Planctomycetia bacterium]